jgi:hypothetical protein
MKEQITIRPLSTISLATSPARRMFSTRSASVKPRSRLRPWRTLSPSSSMVCLPSANSFWSRMLAMVDLPAPDSPVNQTMHGFCCLRAARSLLPMLSGCQAMLVARRSGKAIIPAAMVRLV